MHNKLNYACRSPSLVLSDGNKSRWDHDAFSRWLKCYMQPGMSSTKDRQGRRIWYQVSVESNIFSTAILIVLFFLQSKAYTGGAYFSDSYFISSVYTSTIQKERA